MILRLAALCMALTTATAQTTWQLLTTAHSPSPRSTVAMARDAARDRIVLWGGSDGFGAKNDTWEFDGTDWQQRQPTQSPPPGTGVMAYDSVRGVCVLAMRELPSGVDATWEYDGVTWTRRQLAAHPAIPAWCPMTFDAARGVCVLLTHITCQTWEYDGVQWVQRAPAVSPSSREGAQIAYDLHRQRVLLHGGYLPFAPFGDTWEYDGVTWTLVATGPARHLTPFAYDPLRRRVVQFGDWWNNSAMTTEYGANGWQVANTSASAQVPPPTAEGGLVCDALRGECVMFGGTITPSFNFTNATWRYRAVTPATVAPFGSGCPAAAAPLLAAAPLQVPYVGQPFAVRISNAPTPVAIVATGLSRTTWNGAPLPLPLQSLGMPGCNLLVAADLLVSAAPTATGATAAYAIPANPALAGVPLFLQAFVLAPGANPLGLIASAGLECTIGAP